MSAGWAWPWAGGGALMCVQVSAGQWGGEEGEGGCVWHSV